MRPHFLLLTILLWGHIGFAQMTYNYSSYVQYGADATHIYATAVVDGSATCNNTHIQSLNCSAIYHQGKVYLAVGNTSGWVYGAQVNPNNYISVTNAKTLDDPTYGTDYAVNSDEEVFCSGVGGLVFFQGPFNTARISESAYISLGYYPVGGVCSWGDTCQGTCTADFGFTTNANSQGTCYTAPNRYRQCYDLVVNGSCFLSRVICYGTSAPGVCN